MRFNAFLPLEGLTWIASCGFIVKSETHDDPQSPRQAGRRFGAPPAPWRPGVASCGCIVKSEPPDDPQSPRQAGRRFGARAVLERVGARPLLQDSLGPE